MREIPHPSYNFDRSIALEEYDSVKRHKYDGNRFDFYIWTGLGFDENERKAIQSGLYFPKSFDELTDKINRMNHKEKYNQKEAVLRNMSCYDRLIGSSHTSLLEKILRSDWSLAYVSFYGSTSDSLCDILQNARYKDREFKDKEITVFFFGEGNNRTNKDLRERIREYQFNYLNLSDREECTDSNSPVTIVNIGHTPHEHFTVIVTLTEFAENLAFRLGDIKYKTLSQFVREQNSKKDVRELIDRYKGLIWPKVSKLFHSVDISAHLFLMYSLSNYDGYANYDTEVLSQMFYDKKIQDKFKENLAKIPERIRELKEIHMRRADLLVNVLDTVSYIVSQSREGRSIQYIKKNLLPC
jgi:hypothetical protein